MSQVHGEELEDFVKLIENYNQCFYERNIVGLKNMYVNDGHIYFFDNHADCDSRTLSDHESKVSAFFENGSIETLITEGLVAFRAGEGACVICTFHYRSKPSIGVRTTFYLENESGRWKIRHIHYSSDPNAKSNAA